MNKYVNVTTYIENKFCTYQLSVLLLYLFIYISHTLNNNPKKVCIFQYFIFIQNSLNNFCAHKIQDSVKVGTNT